MILSEILEKYKKEGLTQYEVLHIVSSKRYARGVLLESHNVTTKQLHLKKICSLFKKTARKLKIRWSWVELHTGVFGSQVANSLAKKANKKKVNAEIVWWNSVASNRRTVAQSLADQMQDLEER